MPEEPGSDQGIEARSDTPSPSTGEGAHHLGRSHQVNHSNSAQNPTDLNLDTATLDSPSGEGHVVPLHLSRLIPEYANIRTSGLRRRKIIQDKEKNEKGIPKVFGLIYLFASVEISATKYILYRNSIFQPSCSTTKRELITLQKIYPTSPTPWYTA